MVPALSCRSSRFSPLLMTFSRFCRAIPDTCGMTCHYALLLFMHTHHALTHTHTPTHMHACMHAHIHTHHYTHPPTLPPTHTHTPSHQPTHTQTYLVSFLLHVSQSVCLLGLPATNNKNLTPTTAMFSIYCIVTMLVSNLSPFARGILLIGQISTLPHYSR